jgi:protein-S-isoprenylcysteine O-methyltransferase Ste14
MAFHIGTAIQYCWEALAIVWLLSAAFTKRTVRTSAPGSRLVQLVMISLGFALVASERLGVGLLGTRFLPGTDVLPELGLLLTLCGCLFAIWARITLGANWSGRVTVKADHELIVRGPYALARHPIYTGILLAAAGTTLAIGEWRCVAGLLLIVLAVAIKMKQEEQLMMQAFPDAYPQYRERVKALIPGVL